MTAQPLGTPPEKSARASPGVSDVELLQAIAGGSEAAFEELRDRYRRAVERICRAVGGAADREDCEQEVFARIWRKAALYDPERGSAAAWLLTVARRTVTNLQASRPPPTLSERESESTTDEPDLGAFWLEAALARLSERERTVIELAYYRDLSETAIAGRLRVPLGSVKSWKRRGLNRLATLLGEESP